MYDRVLPRDLFNEANFLKCVGRVSLLIHDELMPKGLQLHHAHADRGFLITMGLDSGDLMMTNMYLTNAAGKQATLHRSLNSRAEWSIYIVESPAGEEEISVFDDRGALTKEFLDWAAAKRA